MKLYQSQFDSSLDISRQHDLADIMYKLMRETNPKKRIALLRTAHMIRNEGKKIRDMRKQLISLMRDNSKQAQGNLRDLHDFVAKHHSFRSD